jgi:dienelactone hydrolase
MAKMRASGKQQDPHPEVQSVDVTPERDNVSQVVIHTARGIVNARLDAAPGATAGTVMVGGVGGGFTGPASAYPELGRELSCQGISSLRLDFRNTRSLTASVHDVLAGIEALAQMGVERVALIGWSFGGAVVISAGALSDRVLGVATVASQSYGTDLVVASKLRAQIYVRN